MPLLQSGITNNGAARNEADSEIGFGVGTTDGPHIEPVVVAERCQFPAIGAERDGRVPALDWVCSSLRDECVPRS